MTGDTRETTLKNTTDCSRNRLGDDLILFACTAKQYPTFWSWKIKRGTVIPAVAKMIRERMAA